MKWLNMMGRINFIYMIISMFEGIGLNYIFISGSNSMNKEVITMEPEQLQFGEENKQLIKVTNRTQDTLDNCFFCMFNTAKYHFSPESFSL